MRLVRLSGTLTLVLLVTFMFIQRPSALASGDPAGCANTDLDAGFVTRTLTADELERSYLLFVPEGYQPSVMTPLVISIHGFTSNAQQQAAISRWHVLAASENFLVVYPNGTGVPTRWNAGNSSFIGASTVDDVQFLRALIADLNTIACVDASRIFVNGLSNGGGMSNRFACQASDIVAAVGGVAGAYSPVDCEITRPVPVIAFHGTADPLVNFEGSSGQRFPSIEGWAREWAERNGCALTAEPLDGEGDVSGVRYGNCDAGAEVILYVIDEGGHTWPGGPEMPFLGKTTQQIDATEVMWAFFQRHPKS